MICDGGSWPIRADVVFFCFCFSVVGLAYQTRQAALHCDWHFHWNGDAGNSHWYILTFVFSIFLFDAFLVYEFMSRGQNLPAVEQTTSWHFLLYMPRTLHAVTLKREWTEFKQLFLCISVQSCLAHVRSSLDRNPDDVPSVCNTHIYTYIHIHIHIYTHIYIYIHTHTHIYTYSHGKNY